MNLRNRFQRQSNGFTLMELLLVIALFCLIFAVSGVNWKAQISRAKDAERKGDLNKLKTAFENYHNDNDEYPNQDVMNTPTTCGSDFLSPWGLPKIPCDPEGGKPYYYQIYASPNGWYYSYGFRIYAQLKDKTDPDIARLGCNRPQGCGAGDAKNNYGVTSGTPVAQ
jgi:prepilin-type N-terminal cleavage/methylation domain-containing protein